MKYRIVKVSEANYKAMKELARDEGMTVSALLSVVFREYLEDEAEE